MTSKCEQVSQAVEHLDQIATFLKILGSYKQGATAEGKVREKHSA